MCKKCVYKQEEDVTLGDCQQKPETHARRVCVQQQEEEDDEEEEEERRAQHRYKLRDRSRTQIQPYVPGLGEARPR